MVFTHFSRNGAILPIEEARISLGNIEYSYGYGVYENIRVSGGKAHFLDQHTGRLMESARIIGLEHDFSAKQITKYTLNLLTELKIEACNIKILLIGGQQSQIFIMPLSPLFPDRKLYKNGGHLTTYEYEREFPHAKTLNMLPSYLAYRDARKADAYDALLVNRQGYVTEGTRTNFFAINGKTIYSPPEAEILLGVTRSNALKAAGKNGYELVIQDISLDSLDQYDGLFITSTSAKIMPVSSIDKKHWEIPETLRELMIAFNEFLRD